MQAKQQNALNKDAAGGKVNQYQQRSSRRQQAMQDGPGQMRSAGPRYAALTSLKEILPVCIVPHLADVEL